MEKFQRFFDVQLDGDGKQVISVCDERASWTILDLLVDARTVVCIAITPFNVPVKEITIQNSASSNLIQHIRFFIIHISLLLMAK